MKLKFCFKNAFYIAWLAAKNLLAHDGSLLAGTLAYNALLSLFPFLIFLSALTGVYGDTQAVQNTIDYILNFAPEEVSGVLLPVVTDVIGSKNNGGLLTFGIVGTLWLTISGIEALRTGLNRAYEATESRSFLRTRAQSLAFVVGMALSLVILSFAIVLGPLLFKAAMRWLHVPPEWENIWALIRYAIGIFVLLLTLALSYYYLPNTQQRIRQVFPGSIIAAMLWKGLASFFSVYLSHSSDYSVTYGSLSGIIITMLFFQFTALIFLYGAELNHAAIAAQKKK